MLVFRRSQAIAAVAAALALGVAACGDNNPDESASDEPAVTETTAPGGGPASAGDDVPNAPDDAIEDRPGGPGAGEDASGGGY